jgi:hypothetical protein
MLSTNARKQDVPGLFRFFPTKPLKDVIVAGAGGDMLVSLVIRCFRSMMRKRCGGSGPIEMMA